MVASLEVGSNTTMQNYSHQTCQQHNTYNQTGGTMSGKAKYCEECKGYGGLYVQVIKRYGDDRIKERHPDKPAKEPCEPCKGTGMLSVTTDKVPVFDVDERATAKMRTENNEVQSGEIHYTPEKHQSIREDMDGITNAISEDPGADVDVPSEAPEPTEDDLENEMEEILADQQATEDEMVGEVVDEDDPVVFEETRIEDEEMPL